MSKKFYLPTIFLVLCLFSLQHIIIAQDSKVSLGREINIDSNILKEKRNVRVILPSNYGTAQKKYPVLYRLDGENHSVLLETISTVERLSKVEEKMPEVIIVAIKNIDRAKDMWPVSTKYYTDKPGAENFLKYLSLELIPYIETNYRTSGQRIICGQSLSAIFTIYAFLSKPDLFNTYMAFSLAFPDCEDYFLELTKTTFKNKESFINKELFITNGLKDQLDPTGEHHKIIEKYSKLIGRELGDKFRLKYKTYEDDGHIPYFSLYDGFKYIYKNHSNIGRE